MSNANLRAAEVARTAYGKLVAILAAKSGDIALAEDMLADAFYKALTTWDRTGIPERPEAWLMTVAQNGLKDHYKRAEARLVEPLFDDTLMLRHDMEEKTSDDFPDERLKLLFVCAHPAIDEKIRTPLMLQTVLGVDVKDIAPLWLLPTATLQQRLVRAKRKIKAANIAFQYPDTEDFAARLDTVLNAIYALYCVEMNNDFAATKPHSLSEEALFLCQLINDLLPQSAEAWGLTALMAFSAAREQARVVDGEYIPLSEQDTARCHDDLIRFGNLALTRAKSLQHIGRFQLEAAVQSVHCTRKYSRKTDWLAVCQLYFALLKQSPSLGAQVAYASALAEAYDVKAGLSVLDSIDKKIVEHFQPYHATKGMLLKKLIQDKNNEQSECAKAHLLRAAELSTQPVIKAYLREQALRV